jgi:hypothetical protein
MFHLFLRARARSLRNSLTDGAFKARSRKRDVTTDHSRIGAIMTAIEMALVSAEGEQSGLKGRLDDVLARAAVTVGNEVDEYLDREPHRAEALNFFDGEITRGDSRLKELGTMITHLKFLKTAMLTRFPDLKAMRGEADAR